MGSWMGLKVGVEGVVKDVEEGVVVAWRFYPRWGAIGSPQDATRPSSRRPRLGSGIPAGSFSLDHLLRSNACWMRDWLRQNGYISEVHNHCRTSLYQSRRGLPSATSEAQRGREESLRGHPIFYLARKTNIILLGGAPCDKRGHSYAWLHIRRMSHTGHWVDILLYIL